MANTFTLINSVTVGAGGAGTINFSSIPSTYTDFVVKLSARSSATSVVYDNYTIKFNGSNSGYATQLLYGNGSSALAAGNASSGQVEYGLIPAAGATSSIFGNAEIYVPNYNSTSAYKSTLIDQVTENNGASAYVAFMAGFWSNTTAVNQITFTCVTGTFIQNSTAYLYGIKNS